MSSDILEVRVAIGKNAQKRELRTAQNTRNCSATFIKKQLKSLRLSVHLVF
jgi:hypothetical protein